MNAAEACERAGITYRQFDYWATKGWLPGVLPVVGTGHKRTLADEQSRHLIVMAELVHGGVHPESATKIATALVAAKTVMLGPSITITLHDEDKL